MEANKSTDWRDRYLTLSEEQEASVLRHAQQIEQLRRTLVRVSLAADGLDQELDQVLATLREQLKKPELGNLSQHLTRVEETILSFEQRKESRQSQMYRALEQVCLQLEELNLEGSTKRKLKAFVKKLHARLANQEEYVAICEELAEIHGLVLNKPAVEGDEKPAGFLNRLLGLNGKSSVADKTEQENSSVEQKNNNADYSDEDNYRPVHQNSSQIEHVTNGAAGSINDLANNRPSVERTERAGGAAIDLRDLANRVQSVLHRLLDDIEPAECVAKKIHNARERVARGLNWQDFVPTLEDIRDLIMQSHIAANAEFIAYLKSIDNELVQIGDLIRTTNVAAEQQEFAQTQLQNQLDQQLNVLSIEVESATDLDRVKSAVSQHVAGIRQSLQKPEQTSSSISAQIKQLLQQVEKLETDAKETYASLSEQREKAQQDSLTGLPNREAYNERSHQEWIRWSRYKKSVSLAVVDIDHFKKVNDTYGHQTGDKVLQLVSRELAKRLREADFIARYGGEEFVVLLPETDKTTALKVLDKLREKLAEIPFHFKEQPVGLSVSIGVAEFVANDTVDAVFERADAALYRAKHSGRNRCCADNTTVGEKLD